MRTIVTTLALLLLAFGTIVGSVLRAEPETSAATSSAANAPDFWQHWGDGRAELAGYELTYPRYGSPRAGTAVTIFVTEDFAHPVRVKHEDPERSADEVYPVMKLNWIQDFATGIYDYNLMTSAFVPLGPVDGLASGTPSKISFSSQEWCGHVYSQLLFDARRVRLASHSYFDGEADEERRMDLPQGGFAEDAVLLWARGFAGDRPAPGTTKTVALLPSLEVSRLRHIVLDWGTATLGRAEGTKAIEVPAGRFEVDTYTVSVAATEATKSYPVGGAEVSMPMRTWTIEVETAWPHRVISWSRSDGLIAKLVGSARIPYWSQNGPGFEAELKKIGLAPRPPRTP